MLTPGHILAVSMGAALGASARWLLGLWLNTSQALLPWGTLAANLIGGYLMGMVLALVVHTPELPTWLRLFLTTGALGGFTTFSAFSGETYSMLQRAAHLEAAVYVGVSVTGSVVLTAVGFATMHWLKA